MSLDRHWDIETNLLVVGAGAAGMTAALVAKLEGLEIILCEKSDMVGGTTATSAGSVWIPGSSQSKKAGIPDTISAANTYLAGLVGEGATDERLSAFLTSGPAMLDYLEHRTSVVFSPPPVHPDYRDLPGAATGGRALGSVPFDGRLLGADFKRVRPPRREFMVLGGMMVGKNDIPPLLAPFRTLDNLRYVLGLLARHAWDRLRFGRGTRLIMGNALVARLLYNLRRLEVVIRFETALKDLVKVGDDVVGAVLTSLLEKLPYVRGKACCWRPVESDGVANFARGSFRITHDATHSRPTAILGTASSPPSAFPERSNKNWKVRHSGCQAP